MEYKLRQKSILVMNNAQNKYTSKETDSYCFISMTQQKDKSRDCLGLTGFTLCLISDHEQNG